MVSRHTFSIVHGLTVIGIVAAAPQGSVYITVCVPAPAVAGLKVPNVALVIPGPLHVPLSFVAGQVVGAIADRLKEGSVTHTVSV